MRVSVIIPFYSNINWLEEAVDSVLLQTFTDYEIIVVNDGSPENDHLFLEKYGDKLLYFKTENKGPAHARNFGIRKAQGEYLAFLDSDDIWLKEKLEKQIRFMQKNNSVWSHTNYSTFNDRTKKVLSYNKLDKFSGCIYPKSLAATHIATPSVVVKKEVLLNNNLYFQEKMRFGQDYFLWLNLSSLYRLDLISDNLLKVRVRGTNTAIRARAHIQVRAQIWNLLKNDSIFTDAKHSSFFAFAYRVCFFEYRFVQKFDTRFNKKTVELISKLIYSLPYVIFKILFEVVK